MQKAEAPARWARLKILQAFSLLHSEGVPHPQPMVFTLGPGLFSPAIDKMMVDLARLSRPVGPA